MAPGRRYPDLSGHRALRVSLGSVDRGYPDPREHRALKAKPGSRGSLEGMVRPERREFRECPESLEFPEFRVCLAFLDCWVRWDHPGQHRSIHIPIFMSHARNMAIGSARVRKLLRWRFLRAHIS